MRGIAIGDVHLCSKPPICRTDDWYSTQLGKMWDIARICNDNDVPLFIAGDLYDRWDIGFRLVREVNEVFSTIRNGVNFICGNHDLPYHSLAKFNDSPMALTIGKLMGHSKSDIAGYSFGQEITPNFHDRLLLEHKMVYLTDPVYGMDADKYNVRYLFEQDEYKSCRLVITGDNHKCFTYAKNDKQVWLNTGPVFRTSVKERDYEPSCWLFEINATATKVTRIKLSVDTDAVDRTEMYVAQYKDAMVSDFVEQLKQQESFQLDFKASVDLAVSGIDTETSSIVYESISEAEKL